MLQTRSLFISSLQSSSKTRCSKHLKMLNPHSLWACTWCINLFQTHRAWCTIYHFNSFGFFWFIYNPGKKSLAKFLGQEIWLGLRSQRNITCSVSIRSMLLKSLCVSDRRTLPVQLMINEQICNRLDVRFSDLYWRVHTGLCFSSENHLLSLLIFLNLTLP